MVLSCHFDDQVLISRDFYFAKILQVETLCKAKDGQDTIAPDFVQHILDVLYATEAEGATELIDENFDDVVKSGDIIDVPDDRNDVLI